MKELLPCVLLIACASVLPVLAFTDSQDVFSINTRIVKLTRVICRNTTSGQMLVFNTGGNNFDCVSNGLVVAPGDKVRVSLQGVVREKHGKVE